jgi:hypothetical protein
MYVFLVKFITLDESVFDGRRMKHPSLEHSPEEDSRSSCELKKKRLKAMHNSRVKLGFKQGVFRHDINAGKFVILLSFR